MPVGRSIPSGLLGPDSATAASTSKVWAGEFFIVSTTTHQQPPSTAGNTHTTLPFEVWSYPRPRQDNDGGPLLQQRGGGGVHGGSGGGHQEQEQQDSGAIPNPTMMQQKEVVGWLDLPNKDQLFVLAVCRLSEPLSNVCLLPYVFYLVRSVLVYDHVAAYSGILVASFPLAQFLVSLPWGWLSDSHGRKFSIVIGIAISVVANAAFGFSRSFGIMRTMTAEVVKERKFQTKAFLLLPLVFNSGMVASLAFGGMLAEPVVNMPWLFGPAGLLNWGANSEGVQWLREYPYALPAMMNASMLAFAFVLATFWLRETLAGKEEERDVGIVISRAVVDWVKRAFMGRRGLKYIPLRDAEDMSDPAVEFSEVKEVHETVSLVEPRSLPPPSPARPKPTLRIIFTGRTLAALVSFGLLPLHNSAFMHIFPVYLSTPPSSSGTTQHQAHASLITFTGGLGLHSAAIGIWLGVFGICGILLQLFIYPRLQARLGTLGVFQLSRSAGEGGLSEGSFCIGEDVIR
ncbi:major facilitator superfamily domain-containing protein [Bombardia bombarda]|uniref:Major facilitator superfamily domain-containing protein n=1 Tax=Bombardia bombarda TaxID=252184 RepID=A0AA39WHY6_9PEZI|nr:major facilitator superfamily domain-containing protein [Bombardia bombarda]